MGKCRQDGDNSPSWLAIGFILNKFDLHNVLHAQSLGHVNDVRVRGPLEEGTSDKKREMRKW